VVEEGGEVEAGVFGYFGAAAGRDMVLEMLRFSFLWLTEFRTVHRRLRSTRVLCRMRASRVSISSIDLPGIGGSRGPGSRQPIRNFLKRFLWNVAFCTYRRYPNVQNLYRRHRVATTTETL
jgi:hypothetical protein